VATLDADDDESPGEPADRTAERLCLTDPHRVAADRGWRGREVDGPFRLEETDRAGRGSAARRIDHDRELDPGPRVEESGGLAVAEPEVDRRGEPAAGRSRHDPSDAVVAPRATW
jgi:hypothetical protein